MVDRRRLVVVVVVDVQARVTARRSVMKSISSSNARFSPAPVEGPDLRVPGRAACVGVGRVDDAEQVLQPELPAVLGVVPRPLDVEEQVAVRRFGQRQQPPVRHQGARPASRSGSSSSYRIRPSSSLATCSRACSWAPARESLARPGTAGQHGQAGEPAPGRDPAGLQRPPLALGDPGDQRQVVVAPPAVLAQVAPPADQRSARPAPGRDRQAGCGRVGGDERAQRPAGPAARRPRSR